MTFPIARPIIARTLAAWALVAIAFAAGDTAAQPSQKTFRIGYLTLGGRPPDGAPPALFRKALRELGYVEGQNTTFESRFAEGRMEALPALAHDLARIKVDVIATLGGPAAKAAKEATSTIPIVITAAAGDAVATGLIASVARPGGNVTGLTDEVEMLSAKRVEILKEALPNARVIAVLWNAGDPGMTIRYRGIESAARRLNVEVQPFGVHAAGDFPPAFASMARRRPDALLVISDIFVFLNRKQLLEFTASQRIPSMYENSTMVREGGFISYGPIPEDYFRRGALYVDRILKGAKPADLPMEFPSTYHLIVNVDTATALGLTIPYSLLSRADDVVR